MKVMNLHLPACPDPFYPALLGLSFYLCRAHAPCLARGHALCHACVWAGAGGKASRRAARPVRAAAHPCAAEGPVAA